MPKHYILLIGHTQGGNFASLHKSIFAVHTAAPRDYAEMKLGETWNECEKNKY